MATLVMLSLNDRGNLGARQLVALAKREGHRAYLVNVGEYNHQTYEFSERADSAATLDAAAWLVGHLHPDLIGISYRSSMAELAEALAKRIRAAGIEAMIIAGGIGATSDVAQAARWASFICEGEGEGVLMELLSDLSEGYGPVIRHERKERFSVAMSTGGLQTDLDALPFPDYDPETTFSVVSGQVVNQDGRLDNDIGAYTLLTSRGCPRACSYCHNSTVHELYRGQKYCRQRSVGHVMEEIAWALGRWDVKLLSIYDDLFIANPEWALEFCRRLKETWKPEGRARRFWCFAHPRYVRADVIEALCDAGMEEICLGVQSGSERILKQYKRGTSREQVMEACEVLARFPMTVKIDIISANPTETQEDILATMDLLHRLPKRDHWHPGLSRLTIFPGSELSREITQEQCEALHGPKQDFIDGMYRAAFVPRWKGLDLVGALDRYDDFLLFAKDRWPNREPMSSDGHWRPLTEWLDAGAPKP